MVFEAVLVFGFVGATVVHVGSTIVVVIGVGTAVVIPKSVHVFGEYRASVGVIDDAVLVAVIASQGVGEVGEETVLARSNAIADAGTSSEGQVESGHFGVHGEQDLAPEGRIRGLESSSRLRRDSEPPAVNQGEAAGERKGEAVVLSGPLELSMVLQAVAEVPNDRHRTQGDIADDDELASNTTAADERRRCSRGEEKLCLDREPDRADQSIEEAVSKL